MKKALKSSVLGQLGLVAALCLTVGSQSLEAHEYHESKKQRHLPDGLQQVGDGHCEIAVAKNGEIYLSVQGGANKGGKFKVLKNIY